MKTTNIALFMAGLSFNAIAIENGTSVNWNNHSDTLKLYSSDEIQSCTGTLIAGKYVLTAAHCLMQSNPIVKMKSVTGQQQRIKIKNAHSDYYDATNEGSGNWHDVAVSELDNYVDTKQIHFFADLTKNVVKDENNDIRVFGFGGTEENLNYATFTTVDLGFNPQDRLDGHFINKGNTAGGDSGSAWLINNDIVSVHKGGDWVFNGENETRETYSTNLYYSNGFILDTVNGWHYPTLTNTSNGSATITVQSLHVNPVTDMAYVSGDVSITGGTCTTMSSVSAFKLCTYEIESQGGIGTLHLSDNESITINKPMPEPTPTPDSSDNGDSGGSLGFLSLISLLGLGFIRKKI